MECQNHRQTKEPMALAKLKPKEDRLEELAERIAAEINERAARMTPEKRQQADSETKKIAARVQRRIRECGFDSPLVTIPSLLKCL
jgi:hypothetical protein